MGLISSLLLDGRFPALLTPLLKLVTSHGGLSSRSVKRTLRRKFAHAAIIPLKRRRLWQHLSGKRI